MLLMARAMLYSSFFVIQQTEIFMPSVLSTDASVRRAPPQTRQARDGAVVIVLCFLFRGKPRRRPIVKQNFDAENRKR